MRTACIPLGIACAFAAISCEAIDDTDQNLSKSEPRSWPAITETSLPNHAWLDDLPDRQARALVREAVERNRDLKAAAARMRQAEARSILEDSRPWPKLDAGGDATRRKSPGDASGTGARDRDFQLALALSWEIDLWGRLRDGAVAARAEAGAARSDYEAARLSIAGNTGKAYFNAVAAEQQKQLSADTLTSFRDNLVIVEQNFERGVEDGGDPALDLRLARANVASAEGQLHRDSRSRDASARSLETLLGRYPSNLVEVSKAVPRPPKGPVPAGLPSQLLLRRPDVLAAERRLASAGYRVSAARKSFLPALTLTGRYGQTNSDLSDLLSPEALVWNIASGLASPVFRGGELRAGLDLAKAQADEFLQVYAATALEAFREVETALAADRFLTGQEGAFATAAEESSAAEALAQEQYARGLVDIITVLESQRRAFEARRQLISVRNDRMQNRIDLYLALGGDFDTIPSGRTAPTAE